MSNDRDARIRERAYAIWEEQGRPDGRHEDHWRQAEAEQPADPMAPGSTEAEDIAPGSGRAPRRRAAAPDGGANGAAAD